jgi:pyruvate dehydrogenase E1 component alpha subunit
MYDSDRYRDKAEIETWRARDPIPLLSRALIAAGRITAAELEALERAVAEEIAAAERAAEAAPEEPVEELTRFVHSEGGPDR